MKELFGCIRLDGCTLVLVPPRSPDQYKAIAGIIDTTDYDVTADDASFA
jgi:hypothetical protein